MGGFGRLAMRKSGDLKANGVGGGPWYVAPALEESGSTSRFLQARDLLGPGIAVLLCAAGLAACGSGERQDKDEPEGEFPVEIVAAEFPNRQRLAQTSELQLGIRNTGEETIPDLAITIFTDPDADGSFSVLSEQADLALPSRPVWILEQGYPKLAGQTASAGAQAVQTNTFSFGELDAGDTREIVWRLTPVQPGTYTVNYQVAAGLQGKATAVTEDGSVPRGEFAVRISDVPPQTRVTDSGKVVPIKKSDLIGQAGSPKQKSELGGGGSESP